MAGRTAIFIARRQATVKNCGRIIVLNRNAVAQGGTYAISQRNPASSAPWWRVKI